MSVTNGINFGMPNFLPRAAYPDEKRWQVAQNLSWVRGRHSVKFGYDLTQVKDTMINLYQGGGTYSFSTLNDFTLDCGNPAFPLPLQNCQAATAVPAGTIPGKHYNTFIQAFDTLGKGGETQFTTFDMAYYVEDTFRPIPCADREPGVCVTTSRRCLHCRAIRMCLPPTASIPIEQLRPAVGRILGPLWQAEDGGPFRRRSLLWSHPELAPRKPDYEQRGPIQVLFVHSVVRRFSAVPQPTSWDSDWERGDGQTWCSRPGTSQIPAIYQTELSLEHEVFRDFTLSGIYMGNRGTRMPVFRDSNLFPPSQTATYIVCGSPQVGSSTACASPLTTFGVPFSSGARPNPSYGYMTVAESVVNTWYNALVIQAKKRFSKGFQLQAGFTWSKALDDDQNSITFTSSNVPMNPFNRRQDYSLSDFDQRRRFTMSGIWQLPTHLIESQALRRVVHGFQLSGILTLADGRPYSGTVSGNPSPSGIQSGLLGVGGSSRVPYVGRNTFTGPGVANLDMRLSREIRFSERIRWQLILEAFNMTNRVQVTGINAAQYNIRGSVLFPRPDFQTISAAGTNLFRERQLQLGTRLTF